MVDAIRRAAGNPDIRRRRLPWPLIRLLSPFVPLFRELSEMRYLWTTLLHMGNAKLRTALSRIRRGTKRCARRSKAWAAFDPRA